MTELAVFMDHPFVEATGLALLHAVWQITMLGGLLVLLNQALRSAQARYLAGCIVLLAMIAVPVGTGVYVYEAEVALPGPFAEILPATPLAPTTVTPLVSEVVAPPAEHATSRGYSVAGWLPWVVVGWLVGMVLLSIRLLGGWTLTRRLVASGARVDGTWQRRFDALRGRMHVEQAVRFLQTSRVSGPVVIGSLRPVVLVPMGLLAGLPPAQVELILLHELAHIRRHDYLVNLLQSMAEVALFFHPVAWWASKQIRVAREEACDDLVVQVGQNRLGYAQALTRLEEHRFGRRLALGGGDGALADRIRRIVAGEATERGQSGWVLGVLAVVCVGLAINLWLAWGQDTALDTDLFVHDNLTDALVQAQQEGKPILLHFYDTKHAGGASVLADLWRDEYVRHMIQEDYIALAVDAQTDEGDLLVEMYAMDEVKLPWGRVVEAPRVYVLSPGGHAAEISVAAYASPSEFAARLPEYERLVWYSYLNGFALPADGLRSLPELEQENWSRQQDWTQQRARRRDLRSIDVALLRNAGPDIIQVPVPGLEEDRLRYEELYKEIHNPDFKSLSAKQQMISREAFLIVQRTYLRQIMQSFILKDMFDNMSSKEGTWDMFERWSEEGARRDVREIATYLDAVERGTIPRPTNTDVNTLTHMRIATQRLLAETDEIGAGRGATHVLMLRADASAE